MKVLKFDQITPEVIDYGRSFSCDVSPSYEELAECASVDETMHRILVLLHDDRCVGIACCQLENGTLGKVPCRIYGAYGEGFFDYSKFCYADGFGAALFHEIVKDARSQRADIVFFSNILLDDPAQLAGGVVRPKPTAIFNSEIEENGFGPLLRKKSVKRHVNKCKRSFDYQVRHFTGNEIEKALIVEMGKLHVETRGFHGDASAFEQARTVHRYLACPPQRVLTQVTVNDETLAFHYGMVFGDTMIWHTPVVNVKYLDYSPLEVLLFEVLSYCEQNGLRVFDLGIGDEPYKERFSNARRSVYEYAYPISLRGKLAHSLRTAKRKQGFGRVVSSLVSRARVGRAGREDPSPGRALYRLASDLMPASDLAEISVIENFGEYVEYCRKANHSIDRAAYQHFRSGHTFFAAGEQASCWAGAVAEVPPTVSSNSGADMPGDHASGDDSPALVMQAIRSAGRLSPSMLGSLVRAVANHFAAREVDIELSRDDKAIRRLLVAAGAKAQRARE